MVLVTKENIHEATFNFINENNIRVINFEESMTEVYLQMITSNHRFIVDREFIREVFVDIAYVLNPNDVYNKNRVLMELGAIMDDSDEGDSEGDSEGDDGPPDCLLDCPDIETWFETSSIDTCTDIVDGYNQGCMSDCDVDGDDPYEML